MTKKLTGSVHIQVVVQFAKSCLTLCDPRNCSTPGFPVLHCLLEFAQTHVHWVSDAVQPQLPSSPPALNLSQHQGLFSSELALCIRWLRYWSFSISSLMNIQGWSPLGLTCLISLQSKGLSRVFFSTTFQKHQFFGTQPSSWSKSHIHTWLLEKPSFDCAEAY